MKFKAIPDGGRYTRPRRGFRAKSHYRDRLKRRGLSPSDVRMETLDALRKRQGYIPRPANSARRAGPTDSPLRGADTGLQVPLRLLQVASNDTLEVRA